MSQISKGDTFADGQQVTGTRLNQLVDSAILLVGSISEQTSIATNGVAGTDEVPINDGGLLKKAQVSDLLNSNLAITSATVTTNTVTSPTGADLAITPAAGQKVDVTGMLESDDIHVTDDLTVADDATISGDLVVTGGSTLTGNVVVDNGLTSNGTANFTGAIQFNGTAVYALKEVSEYTIAKFTATNNGVAYDAWVSSAFTKPSDEIWVIQFNTTWIGNANYIYYRLTNGAGTTNYVSRNAYITPANAAVNFTDVFVINSGTAYNDTFILKTQNVQAGVILNPLATDYAAAGYQNYQQYNTISKFVVYKYATA